MMTPPPLPSVPPPLPPVSPPARQRRPWLWLWILLPLVFCGGGGTTAYWAVRRAVDRFEASLDGKGNLSAIPLGEARHRHPTVLRPSTATPDEAPDVPPADSPFELVKYPAPLGENAAYLTRNPGDGQKHPAVVWAKGGFGGIGPFLWEQAPRNNDQSVNAFLKSGLVVLCPSWRGENGNPGRFESFFGEVDDLLAAVRYAKSVSWVDPERVYLAGHSTGGTLVLLAAVSSDEFRAAFSFGGAPDMVAVTRDGEGYGNTPYDVGDRTENELRSAHRFTAFLKRPTFYFEGGDSSYPADAARMERTARRKKVPFQAFEVREGTHFDILAPLTAMVAEKIAGDTGAGCAIAVTPSDVRTAIAAMPPARLAPLLARWTRDGGTLTDALQPLGENYGDPTPQSLRALVDAARKAIERDDPSTDADIATLIGVWRSLEPDNEKEATSILWRTGFPATLAGWLSARLSKEPLPPKKEATPLFQALIAVSQNAPTEAAPLIAEAVRGGLAPDHASWRQLLQPADATLRESLYATFRDRLPAPEMAALIARHANRLLIKKADALPHHPLDTSKGAQLLESWLRDPGEGRHSVTAAVTLAFCSAEIRERLLPVAMAHTDVQTVLEAAWADARGGGAAGLASLQQLALDENHSATAVTFLRELKLDDQIPPAALEPLFAARAEMIHWLSDDRELDQPPKTLELFDRRTLAWPPKNDRRELFLFKFTHPDAKGGPDRTDFGLVGTGSTFSLFHDHPASPDPVDLYVEHLEWELEHEDPDDPRELPTAEVLQTLEKANPGQLQRR